MDVLLSLTVKIPICDSERLGTPFAMQNSLLYYNEPREIIAVLQKYNVSRIRASFRSSSADECGGINK